MKISILCPSRGRPQRFESMKDSAIALSDEPALVEIRLAVDSDDEALHLYPSAQHVQRFPTNISHIYNALAGHADGDILMASADDVLFRTQGWDTKVREVAFRFPDGLWIGAPNNGDGKRRVNHWFTGRRWLELFGWFLPAHFEHFCVDEWVQEVANSAGRLVYMDDVLIEHMHAKYKKSENDDTYKRKRYRAVDGSNMSDRDIALFKRMAPELAHDKELLRKATG